MVMVQKDLRILTKDLAEDHSLPETDEVNA